MATYRLAETHGCVVNEITAIRFTGFNHHEVIDAFDSDTIQAAALVQYGRVLELTDGSGDKIHVGVDEFVFEHPSNSGHLVVLSADNFLHTYREVEHAPQR